MHIFQQLFIGCSFASIIESKTFTRKRSTSRSLSTCASSRCGWLFEVHSCFIFQSSNLIPCAQQHSNILTSRYHFRNICPFLYTPAVHFFLQFLVSDSYRGTSVLQISQAQMQTWSQIIGFQFRHKRTCSTLWCPGSQTAGSILFLSAARTSLARTCREKCCSRLKPKTKPERATKHAFYQLPPATLVGGQCQRSFY